MVGESISHYRIESELGHGGMGLVYLAADTALDRTVAIKFLVSDLTSDDVAKERFVREAKAAAAVEHDSICAIYEIGETDDGQTYIVMPYYEGKTLKELIADGPLDPTKAVDLAIQIGGGLVAAHAKGVVHRDIKPGNVLVTKRGKAKILDFGLAKLSGQMGLTKTRSSVGTIPYMAPEQIRGGSIDERTDIWALGAVMYEMLAGRRPFHGEYEQAVTYSILNVDPPRLESVRDDLPDSLADVVHRCLAKSPEDRYQTVSELLTDIEVPSGVRPFAGSFTRVAPTPAKRWRALKIVAAVLLVALTWFLYLTFATSSADNDLSERHVAILPFRVIGGTADAEAVSYGLLETLTSSLTRLQQTDESLWVVPSSEVTASMTVADANRKLGANLVVTGSVQLEGDQIRISLTLNDSETLRAIDSDQFDNSGSSTFAIQDEAVLRLTRMLQLELDSGESEALADANSDVRSANDTYLKAIGYLRNQQSIEDLDIAIGLLKSAVADDSLFARAYAALGSAYWSKYNRTDDTRWVDEAIEFSQTALRLNDRLAEVHITLADINRGRGNNEQALVAYQKALEIDPSNSEAYRLRSAPLRSLGRVSEAEASLKRSIELAPEYWRGHYSLAVHYYGQGMNDEAMSNARDGLALAPDNVFLLNLTGAALWGKGLIAEAIETFERVMELDPEYTSPWSNLATAYFYTERYEDAADLYEKVVGLNPNNYDYRGYLADAYFWTEGRQEKARETYQEALELARTHLAVSKNDAEIVGGMAYYFAHLGKVDSARVYLKRVLDLKPPGSTTGNEAIGRGELYLALGEVETAKEWIEQGLSQGGHQLRFKFSPFLAPVRDDLDFMERISVYID